MASFNRVVMSGGSNLLAVPFPYLDKSHVRVSLNGNLLPSTKYTWVTGSQLDLTDGNPSAGAVVIVRRVTPTTPIVTLVPGNLDVNDLNIASLQALYLAEEARDNAESALQLLNDGTSITTITDYDFTVTVGQEQVVVPDGYTAVGYVLLEGIHISGWETPGDGVVSFPAITLADTGGTGSATLTVGVGVDVVLAFTVIDGGTI